MVGYGKMNDIVQCQFNEYIVCYFKGMVNCQNLQDKGPPECNSARG